MDVGDTIPWMESVESSLEHDSRDGEGRERLEHILEHIVEATEKIKVKK
ncbi:MAG: hypothetical protein ACE5GZ_12895 [Gammaproteobacteria bacterium]